MYNYLRTKRLQFTSLQNIQFNTTNFNYKVTGYKITGFTKAKKLRHITAVVTYSLQYNFKK